MGYDKKFSVKLHHGDMKAVRRETGQSLLSKLKESACFVVDQNIVNERPNVTCVPWVEACRCDEASSRSTSHTLSDIPPN